MIDYVRVKLDLGGETIIIWAIKEYSSPYYYFTKVDKYGNRADKIELFITCKADIIWEKHAIMNNKYAQLEIFNSEKTLYKN